MTPRIAVLLSSGCHPLSGRARGAERDKRALELALRLGDVSAVHVGSRNVDVQLRDYLAMGLGRVDHVVLPEQFDVVPALTEWLAEAKVDVILAGTRTEQGASTGLVPYLVAHALRLPVAADASDFRANGGSLCVAQSAPAGERRLLCVPMPAVVTVGDAGPVPRPGSFRRRTSGQIEQLRSCGGTVWRSDAARATADSTLASERTEQMPAKDRIAATRDQAATGGRIITNVTPEAAAREILSFLRERNLLPPSPPCSKETTA
jgi:electron transfer flavoprotein beta subunit